MVFDFQGIYIYIYSKKNSLVGCFLVTTAPFLPAPQRGTAVVEPAPSRNMTSVRWVLSWIIPSVSPWMPRNGGNRSMEGTGDTTTMIDHRKNARKGPLGWGPRKKIKPHFFHLSWVFIGYIYHLFFGGSNREDFKKKQLGGSHPKGTPKKSVNWLRWWLLDIHGIHQPYKGRLG